MLLKHALDVVRFQTFSNCSKNSGSVKNSYCFVNILYPAVTVYATTNLSQSVSDMALNHGTFILFSPSWFVQDKWSAEDAHTLVFLMSF